MISVSYILTFPLLEPCFFLRFSNTIEIMWQWLYPYLPTTGTLLLTTHSRDPAGMVELLMMWWHSFLPSLCLYYDETKYKIQLCNKYKKDQANTLVWPCPNFLRLHQSLAAKTIQAINSDQVSIGWFQDQCTNIKMYVKQIWCTFHRPCQWEHYLPIQICNK